MESTHYSSALEYTERNQSAINMSKKIAALGRELNCVPVLVFRGLSGISIAVAISMKLGAKNIKHGMVYVRKKNEDSHGVPVEIAIPELGKKRGKVLIFVDDFVSSGATLRETISSLTQNSILLACYDRPVYVCTEDGESIGRRKGLYLWAGQRGIKFAKL